MGVNVTGAVNAVEDKLARLPKVSGGNMYAGNNFSKALIQAEKEAKQMAALPRMAEILFLPFGSRRRFTRNSRIHQAIRPSSVIVRVRSSEYL